MKEANSKTSTATKKGAVKGRDNKERKKKTVKKAVKKSSPKPPKDKDGNRTKDGKFQKGHTVNEVWTEAVVLEKLNIIWKTLTTDENGQPPIGGNIVRANDIKLLGEVCLMHSVSKQRWNEWTEKFAPKLKDGTANNPLYSEPITDLIKNIKWLLECRLNYSGATMDIFILKNHYEYKDQQHVDATTKGESVNNPFYEFLKQTGISNHQQK